MLHHHAITTAAARYRTEELIAQAAADRLAAKPRTARAWRLFRWSRHPRRLIRLVVPSTKRATT